MSAAITITFVLVGALAGKTIRLGGKYQFVDGKCTITDAPEQMALRARFLERSWQALPEGDERIAQIEAAVKEATHVKREVPPGEPGPNGPAPVSGDGEPSGEGTAAGDGADSGEGTADPAAGEAERAAAAGDGQPEVLINEKLVRAIQSLDPANEAHWTKDGKPAMTAVEAAYGDAGITRADVEAAAPGFLRPGQAS